MVEWQPISERMRSVVMDDVLHEGVPLHLRESLDSWLLSQIVSRFEGVRPDSGRPVLRRIERECELPLDWSAGIDTAYRSIRALMEGERDDQEQVLDVVQCVLSSLWLASTATDAEAVRVAVSAADLRELLWGGGSAWTVAWNDGRPSLERRVSSEVADRFTLVRSAEDRASEHLQQAWTAHYGRNPQCDRSYARAVKAVEAVAKPVFTPNDRDSTLGKCINALRDAPRKWHVHLAADVEREQGWPGGVHAVLRMMQALWDGQHDRHGDSDDTKPGEVSPAETEAALHLAITLVHLLRSGLVEPIEG